MNFERKDILLCTSDFIVKPLESNIDLSGFSSEYSTYTNFLKDLALEYDLARVTKTYLIIRQSDKKIVAYFSIMSGSITVNSKTRPKEVPFKVDQLGTLHIHHLAADRDAVAEYTHIVKFIVYIKLALCQASCEQD